MKQKGMVCLVGAGPGEVGLLTLRGAELLGARTWWSMTRGSTPRSCAWRRSRPSLSAMAKPAAELSRLLIAGARAGKTVVRLIGGDPYVFGGGGEEAEQLADAGVPFEVVPGVSSLVAAPNYAGIPLTHREFASQLTLLTGHPDPGQPAAGIDWAQVAKTPGTKVVTLVPDRIGQIAQLLVGHGLPAERQWRWSAAAPTATSSQSRARWLRLPASPPGNASARRPWRSSATW